MDNFKKAKALLTALLTSAVALGAQIPSASAEDYVLTNPDILTLFGDVNFDGAVGLADAVQLNRYLLAENAELGNWKNADIAEDGTIDVFDLIYLRRQLLGEKPPVGGTLNINVADMMTGELLEGADINLSGVIGQSSFPLGSFHFDPEDTISIHGLPTSEKYKYVLEIKGLPDNYGNRFGGWDRSMKIGFDQDSDTKDLTVRLLSDDAELNIDAGCFDWTKGDSESSHGMFTVTSKDGEIFYQNIRANDFALPDGEYHIDMRPDTQAPLNLLDPDSDFAKYIAEIYPDVSFTDKSDGIDITVKDGKPDKDVFFDFGPINNFANKLEINCFDADTYELVEGAEMTIIEAPDTYAKKIADVVSNADDTIIIDSLYRAGENAYKVILNNIPEGYIGPDEVTINTGYLTNALSEVTIPLIPQQKAEDVTVKVHNISDNKEVDGIGIKIYDMDNKLFADVKSGEPFVLTDGIYTAEINAEDADSKHFKALSLIRNVNTADPKYTWWTENHGLIMFKVSGGIPDTSIDLYIADADTSDEELESFVEELYPEANKD